MIGKKTNETKVKKLYDKISTIAALYKNMTELKSLLGNLPFLNPDEIQNLGFTYRKCLIEYNKIITSKTVFFDSISEEFNITEYSSILSKAHYLLYKKKNFSIIQTLLGLLLVFPNLIRKNINFIITAFVIFSASVFIGIIGLSRDSNLVELVLPNSVKQNIVDNIINDKYIGKKKVDIREGSFTAYYIFINNINVSFLAFSGGILFGLETIIILLYNGIMVGAVGAIFAQYNKLYEFFALVLPHGGIEISVFIISSAAGLMIGDAIIRLLFQIKQQVNQQNNLLHNQFLDAIKLVFGTMPFFFIAAIIESFISPSSSIDYASKYFISYFNISWFLIYVLVGIYFSNTKSETSNQNYIF